MDTSRVMEGLSADLVFSLSIWAKSLLNGDELEVVSGHGNQCRIQFYRMGQMRSVPAYALFKIPETINFHEYTGICTFVAPQASEKPAPKPKTKAKKPTK